MLLEWFWINWRANVQFGLSCFWPYWPWNVKILISHNNWHPRTAKVKKNHWFLIIWVYGLWKCLCDLHRPFPIFMCSLMHVKAIGTQKSEILAKITFLGIFGQILPKAPIVLLWARYTRKASNFDIQNIFSASNFMAYKK